AGAAVLVHRRVGRRAGAAVDAVPHAVVVGIARTAALVHGGAAGCIGAAVAPVNDPVAVAVTHHAPVGEVREAEGREAVVGGVVARPQLLEALALHSALEAQREVI